MAGSYRRTRKSIKKVLATRAANKLTKEAKKALESGTAVHQTIQNTAMDDVADRSRYYMHKCEELDNEVTRQRARVTRLLITIKELTRLINAD